VTAALALVAPETVRWPACPVCSSEASTVFVAFPELDFSRCVNCGVVYKSREQANLRPQTFYEETYFHGRKSGRDRRFAHRVRKCMRQLRTALAFGAAKSVLDIGCSLGYVMEAAQRLGLRAAGSDISAYAVKVCRERGYRAEVGTLEALPFAAGEFDLVMMKHVLEHTPAPQAALAEVKRVLAPGALVMVLVPALLYWKGLLRRRTYRYFRPDDLGMQHYVYHTAATLRAQLERAGFEVLTTRKAVFRRTLVRGPLSWLAEAARFIGITIAQAVLDVLHMQHEVIAIARARR
jgi:SAM-dependent methyltransferase